MNSSEAQRRVKYALDRVTAVMLLVPLGPVLGLIAVSIAVADGRPVFFRQARPGLDAQVFSVWKFRTMIRNADDCLDQEGFPTRDRITKLGRILRKTSLDELPNVLNIASGEMSFVGPRPGLVEQVGRLSVEQSGRFRMKPGITGLAQVSGRNSLPWSQRLTLDNFYIDNYSLAMDARILLATVKVVLTGQGVSHDRNSSIADDLSPEPGR